MFRLAFLLTFVLRASNSYEELDISIVKVEGNEPRGGRRLQDVEPVCVATLSNGTRIEFEEGESYGDLLPSTPCGAAADYPCFCSSLEVDKIRCPYCPFLTNENTIVCARTEQEIAFVDEFGTQQTCSCEYLVNNEVKTFCDPQDVPIQEQQCALQRNTEQCAALTEFINYDADCPCVSFCQGIFSGCCQYGQSCSVTCPGGANPETDIVSGCYIDPSKPPIGPPPVAPSSAPSQRDCMLRQNTENCPALIQDQQPVAGCGPNYCYNYCDGVFQGCCADDDFECSIQCTGSTQPVITAGCRLDNDDGSCISYGQQCNSSADCCSNRCYFGKCSRSGFVGTVRTKLSGSRGGAAGAAKEQGRNRLLPEGKAKIRGL